MGYVDTDVRGWTELRVHGVSGTTPGALLDHPNVTRVAGNAGAGFYRRSWESAANSEDSPGHRLEAYSWGGLTSGDWTRALWLLLLPFMLLNVAFYMTPASPLGESPGWRTLRRVGESVQRLLALSLTVTLALAAVTVSMDLFGWQCARLGTSCSTGGWLAFYQWRWMDQAGRLLALSALVPIAVVAVLWRLGERTWSMAENVAPPPAPAAGLATWRTPLEDRSFWNGRGPVARLRSLHIATAYAVVGLFLAVPLLPGVVRPTGAPPGLGVLVRQATWTTPGGALVALLVLGLLAVIGTSFTWVALPSLGRGEAATASVEDPLAARPARDLDNPQRVVSLVAVVLLAVTWGLAVFSQHLLGTPPRGREAAGLPWLAAATITCFAGQVVLLAALTGVCAVQARRHPQRSLHQAVVADGAGRAVRSHTAWRGFGTAVLAGMGWSLAGGFAAAMTMRLADLLGSPRPPGATSGVAPAKLIVLPDEYFWAAATALPVLLVVIAMAAAVLARVGAVATGLTDRVISYYSDGTGAVISPDAPRTRAIATVWARATITERLRKVTIVLALAVAAILSTAIVLRVVRHDWIVAPGPQQALVPAGGFVMAGFVLALVWVGRRAYSDANFRRTVGILWDLGTFWPRATHPLAPPCYAERTVPDLIRRIEYLRANGGHVVLSCHSQGTVIGAATIAAMSYEAIERTAFLTYGSPLRRLYARFFPAYFGVEHLARVGELLGDGRAAQARRDGPLTAAERSRWPWVNLHRRSDPIGGPVFASNPPFRTGRPDPGRPDPGRSDPGADLDWQLLDPAYERPGGDSVDPAPLGHSGYPLDPAFAIALTEVQRRRVASPAPSAPAATASLSSTVPSRDDRPAGSIR